MGVTDKYSYVLILLLCLCLFMTKDAVNAAKVTDLYDFLSTSAPGVLANHTITFVTPSGVNSPTDDISVTFGSPAAAYAFDLAALSQSDISLAVDNDSLCNGPYVSESLATSAGAGQWGVALDKPNYKLTLVPPTDASASQIPAGTCVEIRLGNHVLGGSNQAVNPNISDGIPIIIGGNFGDFGSIAVLIVNNNTVSVSAEVNDSSFGSSTGTTTIPSTGGGIVQADNTPPDISNFRVGQITPTSVRLSWSANEPVVCSLRYGTTFNYDLSNLILSSYATSCDFTLDNLKPATNYLFRAISSDRSGNQAVTDSNFSTLPLVAMEGVPNVFPVENVMDFVILPSDKNLLLSWTRAAKDVSRNVLILRSSKFFPSSRQDGDVIYSGLEPVRKNGRSSYLDKKNLIAGLIYYYNIISLDQAGHESSGVLNFSSLKTGVPKIPASQAISVGQPTIGAPREPDIPSLDSSPDQARLGGTDLTISDFVFSKNARDILVPENDEVVLSSTDALLVSIKKSKLPNQVDSLLADLINEEGTTLAGFKYQAEESLYFVNFDALRSGRHHLVVGLYDKDNKLLSVVKGFVKVISGETSPVLNSDRHRKAADKAYPDGAGDLYRAFALLLIAFILWRWKSIRRKGMDEKC